MKEELVKSANWRFPAAADWKNGGKSLRVRGYDTKEAAHAWRQCLARRACAESKSEGGVRADARAGAGHAHCGK